MKDSEFLVALIASYIASSTEPFAIAIRQRLGIRQKTDTYHFEKMNVNDIHKALSITPISDWVDNQFVMQNLHISIRMLQNLRADGILPFSRVRGKIYYRKQDIQNLLANNYSLIKDK